MTTDDLFAGGGELGERMRRGDPGPLDGRGRGGEPFLQKPMSPDLLVETVRGALVGSPVHSASGRPRMS